MPRTKIAERLRATGEVRSELTVLRLTTAERAYLDAQAAARGVSLSRLLRDAVIPNARP